eukprot:jgi/Chrzof1/5004/Cz15g08070.t1
MGDKRPHSPDLDGLIEDDESAGAIVVKKQKTGNEVVVGSVTKEGIKRTSNLQAPIMQLIGHAGEVYSMRFSPDGDCIASGSYDRTILLWRTYGECENYVLLRGHKSAVLEVHWFTSGEHILSCSADKTVRCWDAQAGVQIKRLTEHTSFVNSCCPMRRGPPLFVSGSDDGNAKVWDMRSKRSVQTLPNKYPVTAVAFADAGDQVYAGGLDNNIHVWELRKTAVSMTLKGHNDTVTGLRVSPDGTHLLSNAMDNILRMWDMRPYAPQNRCVKVFTGHQHSFEKNLLRCDWSSDGAMVTAGSADRMVYIWETGRQWAVHGIPVYLK